MSTAAKSNWGAVMTYIISPTRAILVKNKKRTDALWKLPGGGIEDSDAPNSIDVGKKAIAAAIREIGEEAGLDIRQVEIVLVETARRDENGTYFPNFCVAIVSEKKLDTYQKVGDEDGDPIQATNFPRAEIPTMVDLLERHRPFIKRMEDQIRAA